MTLTTLHDLNSLSCDALVAALEIQVPSLDTIYVVRNREAIIFNGNTYQPFEFQLGEVSYSKSETPSIQLQIDNTSRALENYIIQYDTYLKENGIDGNIIKCNIYVLNTNDLSEAIYSDYMELTDFSCDNQWVSFTLGTESLFNKTYPPRKMYQNFCSFKFKDSACAYSGSLTTCNKTLTDCILRSNVTRFGGFVGKGGSLRV